MREEHPKRGAITRARDLMNRSVADSRGEKVGAISDLLLDGRDGGVRYVDVDLGAFQKHVLLPTDTLDWARDDSLVLRQWTRDEVKSLPAIDTDKPITPAVLDELEHAHPRLYGEDRGLPAPRDADRRIVPLSDTREFKLGKGEPDVRKWNVFGADGERMGVVSDMLVDPDTMKIRYLDVDVAEDLFLLKDDRHVLVPLEEVEVKERGKDVWLRSLPARDAARLPAYTGGGVDPAVEDRVRGSFRR
jgi:sporulation protein YlmC with PRC-barrel domain